MQCCVKYTYICVLKARSKSARGLWAADHCFNPLNLIYSQLTTLPLLTLNYTQVLSNFPS